MADRMRRAAASEANLVENAEYLHAREEQVQLERRISLVEERLRWVRVVAPCLGNGRVDLGERVRVRNLASGRPLEVELVGPFEADLAAGRVSVVSPLGRALVGLRAGEIADVHARRGSSALKCWRWSSRLGPERRRAPLIQSALVRAASRLDAAATADTSLAAFFPPPARSFSLPSPQPAATIATATRQRRREALKPADASPTQASFAKAELIAVIVAAPLTLVDGGAPPFPAPAPSICGARPRSNTARIFECLLDTAGLVSRR